MIMINTQTSAKPSFIIQCSKIKDITPDASKRSCFHITVQHKIVQLNFKTTVEAGAWQSEIEQLLQPVIVIGGIQPLSGR